MGACRGQEGRECGKHLALSLFYIGFVLPCILDVPFAFVEVVLGQCWL